MLQVLSIGSRTNELLIFASFMLSAGFTKLPVCVDLVIKVHFYKIFLLLLCVEILLDLHQGLLWAEMRLVVQRFHGLLNLLSCLFVLDLGP
jgi:hypothetical protein